MTLSEELQLFNVGLLVQSNKSCKNRVRNKSKTGNIGTNMKCKTFDREHHLPVCLSAPHKSKGSHHYLKDCKACLEDKKKAKFEPGGDEKAVTGPQTSTRTQQQKTNTVEVNIEGKKIGHKMTLYARDAFSFGVLFNEGDEQHIVNVRADDGANNSITGIAETAVLNGIGKMAKIAPITLQVALKCVIDAEKLTISRT